MSRFLGKLTEEQSDDDDWRSHLSGDSSEGDWFIMWESIDEEWVECVCVFYDSCVVYTAVPLDSVREQIG